MKHRFKFAAFLITLCMIINVSVRSAVTEYHMQTARTVLLGTNGSFRGQQVVDYDADGFDDVALLYSDLMVVYSPRLDSTLWSVTRPDMLSFTVADVDADDVFEVLVYDRKDSLLITYQNGVVDTTTVGLDNELDLAPAYINPNLEVGNLDEDPSPELMLSMETFCCVNLCGLDIYERRGGTIFAFELPSLIAEDIFPSYPQTGSSWLFRRGDLDGDGFAETVATGRYDNPSCTHDDLSGWIVINHIGYALTLYGHSGDVVNVWASDEPMVALIQDLRTDHPGEELVVATGEHQFGWSGPDGDYLYCLKLKNGDLQTVWYIDAGLYGKTFLSVPSLPQTIGLAVAGSDDWHLLDGQDGSVNAVIYGLHAGSAPMSGRFTPAADTGLQIVQIFADTVYLYSTATPTDVEHGTTADLPGRFSVSQNYPNPFNPVTAVEYVLPERTHVTIEIFNVLGQKVRTLVDREEPAGPHSVVWDGTDANGNSVASGLYLYRVQTADQVETKKMLLLK
jgi:hypothetical protein